MPLTPCPYCGQLNDVTKVDRCGHCNGLFEPLSQIATQLAMGPWYVRDEDRPFMPGFSEAILRQQVHAGRITANTILRGPTTNQFWMSAGDVQGVSRLMGTCHACHQAVEPTDTSCQFCKADLSLPEDVNTLGLRYTTDETRAQAQQEVAEAHRKPTTKPTPKPAAKPAAETAKPAAQARPASAPKPAPSPEPAEPAATQATDEALEDDNELANELAEDVWSTGASAPTRRRRRKKGADPLAIGMGVLLLCVFAVGGMILLTSGESNESDEQMPETSAEAPAVERDSVAVSRVSVPALTAYERLESEEIPEAFEERFTALRRLKQQAEADAAAERHNEAYDAYQQLSEQIGPLEEDIFQWRENELAKAEANAVRARVAPLRQQAQDAEAERWAAADWLAAQSAMEEGDRLLTSSQYAQAAEQFTTAESTYLAAQNKAQAGQAAWRVRDTLNETMQAGGSEKTLRKFANEQIDAMLRLRDEADKNLNDQRYAAAEQSYNGALEALLEAQQLVELSRYKKFYAFDAGFRASGLMLAAARGEGIQSADQQTLAEVFEKLGVVPNPASGITPGDDAAFTDAVEPLVSGARDAIIQRHGEPVQACYLIGFHASIIEQTLKTNSLSDGQQKRIHQSLGTIEREAEKAGWAMHPLRSVIEQVRAANRKADLNAEPAETRQAWARLLAPMQSMSSAPELMDPPPDAGNESDPELFPTNGS